MEAKVRRVVMLRATRPNIMGVFRNRIRRKIG